MDEQVRQLLVDLVQYGYNWYSVRGELTSTGVEEDDQLIDLALRAEALLAQ